LGHVPERFASGTGKTLGLCYPAQEKRWQMDKWAGAESNRRARELGKKGKNWRPMARNKYAGEFAGGIEGGWDLKRKTPLYTLGYGEEGREKGIRWRR